MIRRVRAAIYYWFPKFTGRMLDERLGKVHFWLFFVGFNMTFLVQHQLGLEGMPRRVATYRESDGFGTLNLISTIGSFIIAVGVLLVRRGTCVARCATARRPGNDPWDGQTLEWATTSPPPEHNFDSLPPIRSERPFWDHAPVTGRRSARRAAEADAMMRTEVVSSISASPRSSS